MASAIKGELMNGELVENAASRWHKQGLSVKACDDYIHFQSALPLKIVSSGIHGGGIRHKMHIVNFKVSKTYDCADPKRDIRHRLDRIGVECGDATALMTAALLADAGWCEVRAEAWNILVCVTAGFSNAARVTDVWSRGDSPGTINTIAVVEGSLTDDALVGAVISVTEAKAAALADLGVQSPSGQIATGTTTDAVVIAATQTGMGAIEYAGLATGFGRDLCEAVYTATCAAGRRYLSETSGKD